MGYIRRQPKQTQISEGCYTVRAIDDTIKLV
jgi:hypothetical protein